jgi:hypothetical protein
VSAQIGFANSLGACVLGSPSRWSVERSTLKCESRVVNTRLPPQAFQSCKIHRNTDGATLKQPVPIRAGLIGSDRCEAEGISVCTAAPVLALCRKLVAAGHDPQRPLHAYRGNVLALRVRSIGEGAQFAIAGDGVGFRRRKELAAASRMHFAEPEALSSRDQKPLNFRDPEKPKAFAVSPTCPGGTEGKAKSE